MQIQAADRSPPAVERPPSPCATGACGPTSTVYSRRRRGEVRVLSCSYGYSALLLVAALDGLSQVQIATDRFEAAPQTGSRMLELGEARSGADPVPRALNGRAHTELLQRRRKQRS